MKNPPSLWGMKIIYTPAKKQYGMLPKKGRN